MNTFNIYLFIRIGIIIYEKRIIQAIVVSNRAEEHRVGEGLTQEKLAEKVEINPVYMGQIERGYKVPTIEVLLRISRALKVRLRDLVEEL